MSEEAEKSIAQIKENIVTSIGLVKGIYSYRIKAGNERDAKNKEILEKTINSLKVNIKTINNAIPDLLKNVSLAKSLPLEAGKEAKRISFEGTKVGGVAIQKKERGKFLSELKIQEDLMNRVKKSEVKAIPKKKKDEEQMRSARGYLKLSNRFFLNSARNIVSKGTFNSVGTELKKSNMDILFQTYVAMMLFTTVIAFFVGIFFMIVFVFVDFSFSSFSFGVYSGSYLIRLVQLSWIPPAFSLLAFLATYFYPSTERGTLEKKVNQELPFAVIHMSAISGSGIEPSKIFQIIGLSDEYPYLRKEIRKVINQVNLYGYDLVTALNNASKSTPSPKLAELFAGLSTTISTGGDLTEFFEKRAETLMVNYRLEREQYSKTAETFMDIYISVVIATPMMLLLLLIMLQISGISLGLTPGMLSVLIIVAIAIINLVFLGVMHLKQPTY